MGLPKNDDHLVFRWNNPDCKVLFSVTRRGDAASCHIASDKAGLRLLKKAIEEWCLYVFWLWDWCKMITAQIARPSIRRLVECCGFEHWFSSDGLEVYKRLR